jgi:hypothetical protein
MTRLTAIALLFNGLVFSQQPIPMGPPDPNAPSLTLEEKITLTTDDVKKADALEKAQKAYLELIKPIQDHQDAAKVAIEKEHEGWNLEQGPQGWHFVKKLESKPAEKSKK